MNYITVWPRFILPSTRFSLRQVLSAAHCRVQILGFNTYMHTKTGNAKVDTTIRTTCLFGATAKAE
jgi:hypothetical protein